MTAVELKERIRTVFAEPYSVQVYFVLKTGKTFTIKLADIDNERTLSDVKGLFTDYLKKTIVHNDDLNVCLLSMTEEQQKNMIFNYDYDSYPGELEFFKNFRITVTRNSGDIFNLKEDDLSKLFGYVIYLGSAGDGLVLFKRHFPIFLIKRDAFLLGILKSSERFSRIEADDILRMDGKVQLLKVQNDIFVLDLKQLERSLGFKEIVRKNAHESIKAIDGLKIIEDIQVLRDVVEESSFARKLAVLKNTSPVLKGHVTRQQIIDFIQRKPNLKSIFKFTSDGKGLRLDTKKSKLAFLSLLNDNYLRSDLTDNDYEAIDKVKFDMPA